MENVDVDFEFQIKLINICNKVHRNAINIVLLTYNRYFICFEVMNLVQKLAVQ